MLYFDKSNSSNRFLLNVTPFGISDGVFFLKMKSRATNKMYICQLVENDSTNKNIYDLFRPGSFDGVPEDGEYFYSVHENGNPLVSLANGLMIVTSSRNDSFESITPNESYDDYISVDFN